MLLSGIAGAVIGRLKPKGMARAAFATAGALALVPALIWRFRPADFSPAIAPGAGLSLAFGVLFATAGVLFHRAATADRAASLAVTRGVR